MASTSSPIITPYMFELSATCSLVLEAQTPAIVLPVIFTTLVLLEMIEESYISIVIFSENYADSTFSV